MVRIVTVAIAIAISMAIAMAVIVHDMSVMVQTSST
jgi:hypothetical protein